MTRREDLQIDDRSPLLVIDVKGISNYPSDADALQASKHAAIRMREMSRTDIDGLSIINHQRYLPPLDRENAMPFRQELIDAAMEQNIGLMTAWDLYRLIRNSIKFGWDSEDVKPIFYRKGRVDIYPQHYQYIGKIEVVWTDKFGVVIEEETELRLGDRIAIQFLTEFEESPVDSIYVNDNPVDKANVHDPAGLPWPAGKPRLHKGQRVFRISQN
jgi:hypothetical protein